MVLKALPLISKNMKIFPGGIEKRDWKQSNMKHGIRN